MSQPEYDQAGNDYERLRRAEQELGGMRPELVEPIEETREAEDAVEDEAPLPGLGGREGRAA